MKFIVKENKVESQLPHGELNISPNETEGYRPFQLMIASIASCSAMVFKNILEKQRIEIDGLTIEAEIERDESEANRISKINFEFIVAGTNLNIEKLNKSLAIARKNCGMIRSVEDSIEITEAIKIVN